MRTKEEIKQGSILDGLDGIAKHGQTSNSANSSSTAVTSVTQTQPVERVIPKVSGNIVHSSVNQGLQGTSKANSSVPCQSDSPTVKVAAKPATNGSGQVQPDHQASQAADQYPTSRKKVILDDGTTLENVLVVEDIYDGLDSLGLFQKYKELYASLLSNNNINEFAKEIDSLSIVESNSIFREALKSNDLQLVKEFIKSDKVDINCLEYDRCNVRYYPILHDLLDISPSNVNANVVEIANLLLENSSFNIDVGICKFSAEADGNLHSVPLPKAPLGSRVSLNLEYIRSMNKKQEEAAKSPAKLDNSTNNPVQPDHQASQAADRYPISRKKVINAGKLVLEDVLFLDTYADEVAALLDRVNELNQIIISNNSNKFEQKIDSLSFNEIHYIFAAAIKGNYLELVKKLLESKKDINVNCIYKSLIYNNTESYSSLIYDVLLNYNGASNEDKVKYFDMIKLLLGTGKVDLKVLDGDVMSSRVICKSYGGRAEVQLTNIKNEVDQEQKRVQPDAPLQSPAPVVNQQQQESLPNVAQEPILQSLTATLVSLPPVEHATSAPAGHVYASTFDLLQRATLVPAKKVMYYPNSKAKVVQTNHSEDLPAIKKIIESSASSFLTSVSIVGSDYIKNNLPQMTVKSWDWLIKFASPVTNLLETATSNIVKALNYTVQGQKAADNFITRFFVSSIPVIVTIAAIKAVKSFVENIDNKGIARSTGEAVYEASKSLIEGGAAGIGGAVGAAGVPVVAVLAGSLASVAAVGLSVLGSFTAAYVADRVISNARSLITK